MVRWPNFGRAMERWRQSADRETPHLAVVSDWPVDQAMFALGQGVRGVIASEASAEMIKEARAVIASGGRVLWLSGCLPQGVPAKRPPSLSPAQVRVLRLVAAGLCSREIAAKLMCSVRTVETHRFNIQRRTGIKAGMPFMRLALELFPQR